GIEPSDPLLNNPANAEGAYAQSRLFLRCDRQEEGKGGNSGESAHGSRARGDVRSPECRLGACTNLVAAPVRESQGEARARPDLYDRSRHEAIEQSQRTPRFQGSCERGISCERVDEGHGFA